MKRYPLQIEILQYWHCGTGSGGEGDVDAAPMVENSGLPFVPGKHLKGLLREAARFAIEHGFLADTRLETGWFGTRDARRGENCKPGLLRVANGRAIGHFADYARQYYEGKRHQAPEVEGLFETLRQTALEGGLAKNRTLRSMRCTIPMTLEAVVEIDGDKEAEEILRTLCSLVRGLGHARSDGLGRCRITVGEAEKSSSNGSTSFAGGNRARVEFTLIDDVIVSATPGSAGGHRSLDHLPGSALLGIAASHSYAALKEQGRAVGIFHGGAVRFGPAYPVIEGEFSLPVPASWHTAKDVEGKGPKCLAEDPTALGGAQPKQLRQGYLDGDQLVIPVTGHRLKTAIEAHSGTAKESQLFGFSYLPAGLRLSAIVEADEPDDLAFVLSAFDDRQVRIGRSRSNEFGRARAKVVGMEDQAAAPVPALRFLVYAETDLAPVSATGVPSTRPEDLAAALGLPVEDGWSVEVSASFLLTRRYSPWNAFRGCFDPERHVIRAGSVIACSGRSEFMPERHRVGRFHQEGLGRIRWTLPEIPGILKRSDGVPSPGDAPETKCPDGPERRRHQRQDFAGQVFSLSRKWAKDWRGFQASLGPSQWSRLREAATRAATVQDLFERLNGGDKPMFHHGRMADKWKREKGRGRTLAKDILAKLVDDGIAPDLRLAACREAARLVAANCAASNR